MPEEKKLYSREEFEALRVKCAAEMAADRHLRDAALKVLVRADKHRWIHQTTWMGEPLLNLPQDMFAIQEILFRTRPEYIIETGVAWGGSVLFYASLLELLGGKKVIAIDTYIPGDLRRRLAGKGRVARRIELIKGSSVAPETIAKVRKIVGRCKRVMVILDSYHTHDHVLSELKAYSAFVGKGFYIVCGDTIVEDIPSQEHRTREWGPGNNPKTAVKVFLEGNRCFDIDRRLENKLLFTCNPDGYLVHRKK